MDAFKLPLASSLRGKQFLDSALQKRISSSNSLQSTLNSVSFIPVDYLKETIKTNKHVYSKNDSQHDKHCSAHSWPNEKKNEEQNNKVNNVKNMSDKTIYALQVKLPLSSYFLKSKSYFFYFRTMIIWI